MTDVDAQENENILSDSFKKLGETAEQNADAENDLKDQSFSEALEAENTISNEELAALNAKIDEQAAELAQLKDQNLRTLAEMQNLRQRTEKDVSDARKFGMTGFARDMISVLENVTRAESSVSAEEIEQNELLQKIMEGLKLTREELLKTFESNGIKRIDPQGEKFDHNFHQAVVQIPDAEAAPNTVVQVMQAGYVIHGRLLRPAMVGVSTTPPATE